MRFASRTFCVAALTVACMVGLAGPVAAQSVVNELLGGRLTKPKVGQWLWYDLYDKDGKNTHWVRQAVTGSERVGRQDGYWVEFELIPRVGYRQIYKVLLTGPASNPSNVKRFIYRDTEDKVVEVDLEKEKVDFDPGSARRKSQGMEDVATGSGPLRAERLEVEQDGRTIELWVSDAVRPSEIVRMKTPDGEMLLQRFGEGGEYGTSAFDRGASKAPDVEIKTEQLPPAGDPAPAGEEEP
jgi:hypothetical protein